MIHFFRWIAIWFTSRVELHKALRIIERERDTNLHCYLEVSEENGALLNRIEELEAQNLRLVHFLGETGRGAAPPHPHEVVGLQAIWRAEGLLDLEDDWIEWETELR